MMSTKWGGRVVPIIIAIGFGFSAYMGYKYPMHQQQSNPAELGALALKSQPKVAANVAINGLDYVYVTAKLQDPERVCTSMLKIADVVPGGTAHATMYCYPVPETFTTKVKK